MDKLQQKQRWKYVLEKFSYSTSGGVRRNPIPPEMEAQILEMPECKRGRFVVSPGVATPTMQPSINSDPDSTPLPQLGGGQIILDVEPVVGDILCSN